MSDPIKKPKDVVARLTRRSWLHNATMAATSAVMLFFVLTGCTKEQWDHLKNTPHPGGGLGSGPSIWYNLKVTYKDNEGKTREGFMGPIGTGGDYFEYMKIGGKSKFRLHPGENGFEYWEIDDGLWLTLSYWGWAYRSDSSNRVGWKIVNGKLYSDYSRWEDYPLGCEWYSSSDYWDSPDVPPAYYVGVDLGDDKVLTNCELVPAQ
jgi:hypothetical protein